jgi:adenylate cyclase
LVGLGADEDEIEQAERDGTLSLLALERIMVVDPPAYDLGEACQRTGLNPELLVQMWRSLGYPEPRPGELVFNEKDLDVLSKVGELIRIDPQRAPLVLQVSRVIGSSMARIASSLVDSVSGPTAQLGPAARETEVAVHAGSLLTALPEVLDVVYRKHLRAAAHQRMVQASSEEGAPAVVVGFADLVGFTALSQQVSEVELAAIVGLFEDLVFDVITAAGGRVIKTIGDEVMFSVGDPKAAAEIALALVEGTRAEEDLSDVRVGLAFGPVLDREGDLYGPVVNLASRITVIALPGTVVVAPEVADGLEDDPSYVLRPMRPRYLKDIGRVRLAALRRVAPVASPFAERRKALLESGRARVDPTPTEGTDET